MSFGDTGLLPNKPMKDNAVAYSFLDAVVRMGAAFYFLVGPAPRQVLPLWTRVGKGVGVRQVDSQMAATSGPNEQVIAAQRRVRAVGRATMWHKWHIVEHCATLQNSVPHCGILWHVCHACGILSLLNNVA